MALIPISLVNQDQDKRRIAFISMTLAADVLDKASAFHKRVPQYGANRFDGENQQARVIIEQSAGSNVGTNLPLVDAGSALASVSRYLLTPGWVSSRDAFDLMSYWLKGKNSYGGESIDMAAVRRSVLARMQADSCFGYRTKERYIAKVLSFQNDQIQVYNGQSCRVLVPGGTEGGDELQAVSSAGVQRTGSIVVDNVDLETGIITTVGDVIAGIPGIQNDDYLRRVVDGGDSRQVYGLSDYIPRTASAVAAAGGDIFGLDITRRKDFAGLRTLFETGQSPRSLINLVCKNFRNRTRNAKPDMMIVTPDYDEQWSESMLSLGLIVDADPRPAGVGYNGFVGQYIKTSLGLIEYHVDEWLCDVDHDRHTNNDPDLTTLFTTRRTWEKSVAKPFGPWTALEKEKSRILGSEVTGQTLGEICQLVCHNPTGTMWCGPNVEN